MAKKWIVRLTKEERARLTSIVRKGRTAAYKRRHAEILLRCDQGDHGPGMSDRAIADALDVALGTPRNVRKRWVEEGLDAALNRKKQKAPSRLRKLDGEAEAKLLALACTAPPNGRAKWTLQLLADELVTLEIVDSIAISTIHATLKRTRSSRT